MDEGRDTEQGGSDTGLRWDGLQFVPAAPGDEPDAPALKTPTSRPSNWVVGCISTEVGLVVLLFTLIALSVNESWVTKLVTLAVVWAIPVGLALWWRTDYMRNRPLPDGWRALDSNGRLAHVFRFQAAELRRNSAGKMSWRQRLRIFLGDLAWWLAAAACIGGPVLLLGFAPYVSVKAVIVAVFVVGVGIWALYRAFGAGLDSILGRVRSEETDLVPLEKHGRWVESLTFYRMTTQHGVELKVPHAAYDAVRPRRRYRVYFAPMSKQLISAEAID